MLYPQSVHDPAPRAEYFFGYLKIEDAIIKLSSYNYKYYKNRKKIKVERKFGY